MSFSSQKRWFVALVILFLALVMTAVLATGCGDGETTTDGEDGGEAMRLSWPTIYRDLRRTGRCDNNGPETNDIKWTFEAGAQTMAWSVLDMNGNVVAGFEGMLINVDPDDSTLNWEFSTTGEAVTTPCVGEDGTIYASAGSKVYALTPEGEEKWSYDVGAEADEPTAGSDGSIYAGSVGGRLVALSKDGELKWEQKVEGDIRSPSIDDDNLYCSASPLVLYAFDMEGNKQWEVHPQGELPVYEDMWDWMNTLDVPSIGDDGTIYAGSLTTPGVTTTGEFITDYAIDPIGKLYAVSPDGQLKWSFICPYQGLSYFQIHSPSIGRDGTLYAGTSHWRVLAIDPDGNLIWEFNTGEDQTVCPSVFSPSIGKDGLLYAATTSGKMFCITPQGTEQWRFEGGDPWLPGMSRSNNLTPPPIGTDGTLFTVMAEGKIFALKDGAEEQDGGEQPPPDDLPPIDSRTESPTP